MSKRKVKTIFLVFSTAFCTAANLNAQKTPVEETGDRMIVDKDGNRYSIKLLSDGNLWMGSNLNLKFPNSYCYDNEKKNCDHYGRLYTWTAANEVCKFLGDGWRLPSDSEWNQLVVQYGKNSADPIVMRRKAFEYLLQNGGSGFGAILGGGRDMEGQFGRLEAHGFYWTATENDSSSAIYYNFAKGSKALYRQDNGEIRRAFSVRCIKKPAQKN
jgi:uncharacterized protein (TIGR02145 family)